MKLNKCKKLATAVGLALGLTLAAGSAQSAVSYSFEDDDIDFIFRDGNVITSGPILAGDIFVSPFEIPTFTIDGVNGLAAGTELTGLAAVQLQGCFLAGAPVACDSGIGTTFVFEPVLDGLNSILALGTNPDATVGLVGDAGGGAMIAMFLNGTSGAGGDIDLELNRSVNPATNCTSLADCIDQASQGTLFQVDGFRGDPDEFWAATSIVNGGGDIGTVLGTNNNLLVVGVNFGLSTFFQLGATVQYINIATGLPCGNPGDIADGCVQFSVSATITGGQGLTNGAFAHSDFDGQKWIETPEPGILALLGLGLAGLGFGASRRKSMA